mgnify:FL=1
MKHMREKTGGFFAEFRKFIARGNVMDMAVGVIIGGAFKSIADSLTADILMPLLGILTNQITFSNLTVNVGGAVIGYGKFLEAVLNFLIMAFAVFCIVKAINSFHRRLERQETAQAAAPAPSQEERLLTEIRDLLKAQKEER